MRRQVVRGQPALQAFHRLSRVFLICNAGPSHQRSTLDLGSFSGDVLEDPIFEASSSSTSGTLQRSSQGFPTTMGAEKPFADRRATKHGTRLLHPSTEICEVRTRRADSTSNGREQSTFNWWNSMSAAFRNDSLKKIPTLATFPVLEKELQDRSVLWFHSPFRSSALD